MKILIDADGCPVVDEAVTLSTKYSIECIIICDTSHNYEKDNAKTIIVSKGADSVDFALVNMIKPNDLVITQDYGLAAMSIAKLGIVLNQDGMVYDDKNIDSLMFARHLSKEARKRGERCKKIAKRTIKQDISFTKKLEQLIKENI